MESLPSRPGLDIGTLSRLFADTTNSYKHLLFIALLEALQDRGFAPGPLRLDSLAIGMLAVAWHPAKVFRLSLGVRDQAIAVLDGVDLVDGGPLGGRALRAALTRNRPDCAALLRWVPYRLIAPFFADELRGRPDGARNSAIRVMATDLFLTRRPLYRFLGREEIELHPDWNDYIAANFPIVAAWADRRWIGYLQSRNPTIPAISEKTRPPPRRDPLTAQVTYWRKVIASADVVRACIYSGRPLDAARFHLDHFIPWTFVCHDALWNLVPVSPEANLSKGDRLPHAGYLPALAATQHAALVTARRILGRAAWTAASASFIGELRVPEDDILNAAVLAEAYDRSVRAQLDIARTIGFEPGWRFVG